jgi:hypothetical protein
MKAWSIAAATLALAAPLAHAAEPSPAQPYPTHEIVLYVEACMSDHDGATWDTLYGCSCKFDAVRSHFDHDTFVAAITAKHGRSMAGERGGVLRETEYAENLRERLAAVEGRAERHCFIPSLRRDTGQ